MKISKNKIGQSLLETIFAIGILLIAVTAILALVLSNIVGQRESEVQIIANNLAREGIEVVRTIRDSNWLAGEKWDKNLTGNAGDETAIPIFDQANNKWTIDFSVSGPTDIYIMGGIYNQNNAGQPTVYRRGLLIREICLSSITGLESIHSQCTGNEDKVGLSVDAGVVWREKDQWRQLNLQDLLYAWK